MKRQGWQPVEDLRTQSQEQGTEELAEERSDTAAGAWKTGSAAAEAGESIETVGLEVEVVLSVWMMWTRPLGEKGWTASLASP